MKKILLFLFTLTATQVFSQVATLKVEGAYPGLYILHTTEQAEQLLSLAKAYNLSPNLIAAFNNIKISSDLKTGETVKIPLTPTNFQSSVGDATSALYIPLYIITGSDETTASVIKLTGIKDSVLKRLNAIDADVIKADTKLTIGYLKVKKEFAEVLNSTKGGNNNSTPQTPVLTKSVNDSTKNIVSNYNSDELFQMARKAAFDRKDYSTALNLSKQALSKSPGYSDIRIFAGRLLTWKDQPDSARQYFDYVLQNQPDNKELYIAYTDLEYWNDNYTAALAICEKGLAVDPNSKDLLLKKVKILDALKKPVEVQKTLERLLKIDKTNTEVRALLARNKDEVFRNKIGFSYEYTYFDKQFSDPWHIATIDYSRQTKLGSIGGHINYANRFKSGGTQYELEAYPHISRHFYSYVGAAYSTNVGVFPKYRGGFSLYAILPKSMEAEAGLRYLYFSDATYIYTAAISKYYKSWLFTARTYLTPGDGPISQTYNLVTRYYYGGADDYFSFTVGRGISPDDKQVAVLLNTKQYVNLVTSKAGIGFRHAFKKKYVLTLDAAWMNQEYRPDTKGNQLSAGVSYQVRF